MVIQLFMAEEPPIFICIKINDNTPIRRYNHCKVISINKNKEPLGVIYPLPQRLIYRFFEDDKTVFIKFSAHESISVSLKSCKKLIFYKSRGKQELIGEGDIENIFLMSIHDIINTFEKELFLSRDELASYAKSRNRKALVFKLSNLRKYQLPVKLDHYVTMAGSYISDEDYTQIVNMSPKS